MTGCRAHAGSARRKATSVRLHRHSNGAPSVFLRVTGIARYPHMRRGIATPAFRQAGVGCTPSPLRVRAVLLPTSDASGAALLFPSPGPDQVSGTRMRAQVRTQGLPRGLQPQPERRRGESHEVARDSTRDGCRGGERLCSRFAQKKSGATGRRTGRPAWRAGRGPYSPTWDRFGRGLLCAFPRTVSAPWLGWSGKRVTRGDVPGPGLAVLDKAQRQRKVRRLPVDLCCVVLSANARCSRANRPTQADRIR